MQSIELKPLTTAKVLIFSASLLSSQVNAEEGPPQVIEQEIETISIIGSRVSGRSVEDLPVPVDILSAEALLNTGHTEVGRMLQAIAPSFNFSSSSISWNAWFNV